MTIRHVALFRWIPGKAPDLPALGETLRNIVAEIDGGHEMAAGSSLGLSPGTFDYGLTADFDTEDAYLEYRSHPRHQRLLDEVLLPAAEAVAAVQIALPDSQD